MLQVEELIYQRVLGQAFVYFMSEDILLSAFENCKKKREASRFGMLMCYSYVRNHVSTWNVYSSDVVLDLFLGVQTCCSRHAHYLFGLWRNTTKHQFLASLDNYMEDVGEPIRV